jgi:hypothetical protein
MRNVAYGLMIAGLLVACGDDGKDKPAPEVDAGDTVPLDGNGGADAGGDGDGEVDTRECAQKYNGFGPYAGPYAGPTAFVTTAEFDACGMACQLPPGSTDEAYETCWAEKCAPNVGNTYACYNDTLVACYTRSEGGLCHAPEFTNFVCCSDEKCNEDQTCAATMCEAEYGTVIDCVLEDWGIDPPTDASDVCFAELINTCFAEDAADGDPGDGDTGDLDAGTPDAGSTDDASVSPRPTLPRTLGSLRAKHVQLKRSFAR